MTNSHVLLIDDSLQVHERVRRAFKDAPVSVGATDSIIVAQGQVFSKAPPRLVILDLQMPILNGGLLGRSLKRRTGIPIVIFSSESADRLREVQAYVGAEAALSKSVSDAELVETVLRVLEAPRTGPSR